MNAVSIERPTCDRCGGYVIRGRLCENCRSATEDVCHLCQEIVFDDPAIAEFGVCRTCMAKMQDDTDWAAYQAALWEE